MDTAATAQTILTTIRTGKTTAAVIERQMAQMEAALDRGAQVIGLKGTPDEAREVIRLVRAGLAPAPEAAPEPQAPAAIEAQAAVTLRHTRQDALLDAIDHTHTLRLTTQHAASSYGQPVVVQPDGTLVNYLAIESLHLLGSSAQEAAAVARTLEPFDIRITWQARGETTRTLTIDPTLFGAADTYPDDAAFYAAQEAGYRTRGYVRDGAYLSMTTAYAHQVADALAALCQAGLVRECSLGRTRRVCGDAVLAVTAQQIRDALEEPYSMDVYFVEAERQDNA